MYKIFEIVYMTGLNNPAIKYRVEEYTKEGKWKLAYIDDNKTIPAIFDNITSAFKFIKGENGIISMKLIYSD